MAIAQHRRPEPKSTHWPRQHLDAKAARFGNHPQPPRSKNTLDNKTDRITNTTIEISDEYPRPCSICVDNMSLYVDDTEY